MQIVDANVVLRYSLEDHAELSPRAKEIFNKYLVEVPIEVLCEVVFVLKSYYKIDQVKISAGLLKFFETTKAVIPHREAVFKGLEYFGKTSLDFVDCILAGYYEIEKADIHTFDGKLERLIKETGNTQL
jgi:predicted nucleic-acid-binding protein